MQNKLGTTSMDITMKLHRSETAKICKKFLKPQVERRRRERINHSLERLTALLLKEPQQGQYQRRVEKAEILEHTVLFLKNTGDVERKKAEVGQHSFKDGFSTCLQRAARFLGPEGKGLLNSPLAGHLVSQAVVVVRAPVHPSDIQTSMKSPLSKPQMKMQDSRYTQQVCGLNRTHHKSPQQRDANVLYHCQSQSQAISKAQNLSVSQAVWRPWP
ncbi:hairy and enhancer of split related-7 [Hypomesus transpacificus]|uniref:hairy and enhancer of split related-7 n=1 Tax=Hypomesus transpacificus TaxID=137520 RepID=UPI001F073A56|nr:hairy and enhancer of split related-7 [Hypomesus transpacificus]